MKKLGFILSVLFFLSLEALSQEEGFQKFLDVFVPKVEKISTRLNKLHWILETTGSKDAVELVVAYEVKLSQLFHNEKVYDQLLQWNASIDTWKNPLLQRELKILLRQFKTSRVSEELIQTLAQKEAELSQIYVDFRPTYKGKIVTQNDISQILEKETDISVRQEIWELSKEIGNILAPHIVELVVLRNQYARQMGYANYFEMSLDLSEVDFPEIERLFEKLREDSEKKYNIMIGEIHTDLAQKYHLPEPEVLPWAWSDPFCQKDPLEPKNIDDLVSSLDPIAVSKKFYDAMGFSIENILQRSDLYPRDNKNQHAFCISIDRKNDVRILCNMVPTIHWLATLLHELGHALYDEHIAGNLPWLLRTPPHMSTTEAMALLVGRAVFHPDFFTAFVHVPTREQKEILSHIEKSQQRTQLLFSRFVMMITMFEKALYENPHQDLNALWWSLCEKYQKIHPPKGRKMKGDWAAKYHIAFAPVYYYSYLLGEMFASSLQAKAKMFSPYGNMWNPKTGKFLQQKLFAPGDSYSWPILIEHVLGHPLNSKDWMEEFAHE
ncbi:MAG: M2 family metallopeptidase [Parachlamydiales bacterium]|nr:M2 family metallopeptidase [Parachlamydiales bacterium]